MAIQCARCKTEGPALPRKPLGGKIGQRVLDNVCANCWAEWDELQLKIINEYRLNLAIPQHYDMIVGEMLNYLGLSEGATGQSEVSLEDAPTG